MTQNTLAYISSLAFADEMEWVKEQRTRLAPVYAPLWLQAEQRAKELIGLARSKKNHGGIEHFLKEYSLDTKEGVALMCLAEALLRIPDGATADMLISDKLDDGAWQAHLGNSDSLFVNATSWGLMFTGGVIEFAQHKGETGMGILRNMVRRLGAPVIREAIKQAMRIIGGQFVMGESIEEAIEKRSECRQEFQRYSYDMLGEGARNAAQAEAYYDAYAHTIAVLKNTIQRDEDIFSRDGISIKLSGLHPRFQWVQYERVMKELLPRVTSLVAMAAEAGIPVAIDAEESSRLDISLSLFDALYKSKELAGYEGLGFVVQAYQKRSLAVIEYLAQLASSQRKKMPVRLVKGAYWDAEIKAAQQLGLPSYPVFTRKAHTDLSYLSCAHKLLESKEAFYPQFATHNALTAASIEAMAKDARYEFQRLHGMGEALHELLQQRHISRVYAPVGKQENLLAYLIRRLLENGANTSFVHQMMDKDISLDEMLHNPLEDACDAQGKSLIPLPRDIYGQQRVNSYGADMGNRFMVDALSLRVKTAAPNDVFSQPSEPLEDRIIRAHKAHDSWSTLAVSARADILLNAADMLASQQGEFLAYLVHEGKKIIPDAIAEIREAQDFLRYYAMQAKATLSPRLLRGATGEKNEWSTRGRGVFAAISPWNFPLAIFTGQVAAALVAGNAVIAKPAEQTPQIAQKMVRLFHAAGVPVDALQLLVGGADVGAALVARPDIAGVVFTGSTSVASNIARSLAQKPGAIVPLIAETGGQNCMIVDSSALIEQAVDDALFSAFSSAGQRCSALRVLYLQEDIAEEFLAVFTGAMQELTIGRTQHVSTDIGPVIDQKAKAALLAHIEQMKQHARLIAVTPLPSGIDKDDSYVPPHLFEIKNIQQLTKEVFGPVLHIVRFKAQALDEVIQQINSTGYGLTCGISSRIDDRISYIASRVHAGNIYVNRSMVGAVVGVQPFGGEGLSGTGPKAGGPFYVQRFVHEYVVTVNTAAIGGNLELLL